MIDSLRLALGTFSAIPVRPPQRLDLRTVRGSLLWAPVVGAALGAAAALVGLGVRHLTGAFTAGTTLAALAGVATLVTLSRGLHWDGLADTADALGSRRDATGALDIMKRSDIGPYGVLALLLVLMVQVFALAVAMGRGTGGLSIATAAVAGRGAVAHACTVGVKAARPGGLGATFAETNSRTRTWAMSVSTAAAMMGVAWLTADHPLKVVLLPGLALLGATLMAIVIVRQAVRRFGGVTGDVLGAVVECATAAALVVFALV